MQERTGNLKEHPDLYRRSIKGGYWLFGLQVTTQFFDVIKSIIVFNFLFSENLELILVANLLMAILTASTESGFHAALVQKKENIEDYLDTAWVIGILRGGLLYLAIYFAAPLFASFRVEPEDVTLAISVIRAMGLCFLIRAFQNIGVVYFQKELQFDKSFWLTMAGTIADIVFSICFLLIYRSVWAVVAARLLSAVINLIMGYVLCSYRPKVHFVPQKARELWKFGKWLFVGNIIRYLLCEGDDWFVWFYLGPQPFTLYRYAYRFTNIPSSHISSTISRISFPAYSKIQHDIPRLREAFLKVFQITAVTAIPVAFLIFMLGSDFVRLFLVKESHAMIPLIKILAVAGLMASLEAAMNPLFRALGKPHKLAFFHSLRLVTLAIIIYPFGKLYSVQGVAFSTVLARIVILPYIVLCFSRLLRSFRWEMFKPLLFPTLSSCLMGATLFFSKRDGILDEGKISFFVAVLLGIVVYMSTLLIFDLFFKCGMLQILREQWSFKKQQRTMK
jgi:O-antigen/teichoic acid export membrane protein